MQFVGYFMLCNRRFDECEVHDDHYVLVDHDDYYMLVVYDVFVVFVTRQLICQFHKLLVKDSATMDITFSCARLFTFAFLCCCIKGAPLLLFVRVENT